MHYITDVQFKINTIKYTKIGAYLLLPSVKHHDYGIF